LRERVTLVGGFAKPDQSLGEVLLHALTLPIHEPDIPLGIGAAIGGGQTQQSHRRRVVAALIGRLAVLERPRRCCAKQREGEKATGDKGGDAWFHS
jgi:hypothetical protein